MQSTENTNKNKDINEFTGDFIKERKIMDYNWFNNYTLERQLLQDKIIHSILDSKKYKHNRKAIYTCGIFGSGKTRTLKWMNYESMIDLDSFVIINPDSIKYLLPEFSDMLKKDSKNASTAVHKESTYISLIIEYVAINSGMNYIVDGSLQNWEWYITHLSSIKDYQKIIIRIYCDFDVAVKRCDSRSQITGRYIDHSYLKKIHGKVPLSFEKLKNNVDLVIEIDNTISPMLKRLTIN